MSTQSAASDNSLVNPSLMLGGALSQTPVREPVRVMIIVADPPMYRRGLAAVLGTDPSFVYLGEALDAAEALRQVLQSEPEVALIDADLANLPVPGGRTLLSELRRLSRTRFVMLCETDGALAEQKAQAAGAAAVLPREASASALSTLMLRVGRSGGGSPEPGTSARRQPALGEDLTRRECQLLELMARGLSNQDIATQLAITVPTVKFHVTNILAKLHADNRTEAVLVALRHKLVTLD